MNEMVRGVDYSGFCGNEDCSCWTKGPVCEEFMGVLEEYPLKSIVFCWRCGWHLVHHSHSGEESP